MAGLPSLSSVGHSIANVARAAVQGLGKLLGKIAEVVKKPPESTSVANTVSPKPPVTTILGDRDIMNPDIASDIIEDYGGLNETEERKALAFASEVKEDLLGGVETKRQIGGGDNFSDEQIAGIKEKASKKADQMILERVKQGEAPDREGVVLILEMAIFDSLLELDENQGLTDLQVQRARDCVHGNAEDVAQSRKKYPSRTISEMLGIPKIRDHIEGQNPLTILDRAKLPIMNDVRLAAKEEQVGIQEMQEAMILGYVDQIKKSRSGDPDLASVDAKLLPKLREALSDEMQRDVNEMSNIQFAMLVELYEEIHNNAPDHTEEENSFLQRLQDSSRIKQHH